MDILTLISVAVVALGGMFSFTRQAQMLQQNSYFPSRYWKWLWGEFTFRTYTAAFFCGMMMSFLMIDNPVLMLVFSVGTTLFKIYYARLRQKKSIKPLVYTARVKRQYFSAAVILAVFTVLGALVCKYNYYIVVVLSFLPCVTVLLARTVNQPVESLITRWYINDAKKKLRSCVGLKVIGITGSYGKTSTKYVLAEFLNQKYNVVFTPASFNTPLGVVRTVREKLRPDTDIFIAEMGAKNVGDIKELCDIAHPDLGIITSCGPQHLDTFGSVQNVVNTKFELCDSVTDKGGEIYLNLDNDLIKDKVQKDGINCVGYGKAAEYCYENLHYSAAGAEFDVVWADNRLHIKTKLLGLHNVINITAAAALALRLGVSPRDIAFAAIKLKPVEHRLEIKSFINGSTLLDDAYNANPVGSIEAVKVLGQFSDMKRVVVTPGLVELGDKEYECNYNLGAECARQCDVIILVGEQRSIPLKKGAEEQGFKGELLVVKSFKEAMTILGNITNKETVVLFENDLPDNYSK